MSDWDDGYNRNKGKAKSGFEEAGRALPSEHNSALEQALAGLKDRRRGPVDRREVDLHKAAKAQGDREAMAILSGQKDPTTRAKLHTEMQARAYHAAHKEVSEDERRRTVPQPQLTPTGMIRYEGDDQARRDQIARSRERHMDQERMRALMSERMASRHRGDRERGE